MIISGGPIRHMVKWVLLVALVTGVGVTPLAGQDRGNEVEDALNDLLAGALTIHIHARIVDENQNEEVWNMDVTRVTISGRAVAVRMDGRNVTVHAEFTPYWESEDRLLLVAQGQTWIETDDPDAEPEYRTSFTTLPIRLGEPILFLPLGSGQLPVDTQRFGHLNIELEINVERYQS